MKRPYKTKKRIEEFIKTYESIAELNHYISNLEIEISTFEKYKKYDEAQARKELVEKFKDELKEYKKQGWDIDYNG